MLEYDRIDYINKTMASKECDICHYWYFKDVGYKYEQYICNGCHDLMQKAVNFNDITIVLNNYRVHFSYVSRVDAINIMKYSNLNEKTRYYNFS